MKSLRRPLGLRKGDTLAIVRPSSRLEQTAFTKAIEHLKEEGFCVVVYPEKFVKDRFFSSSDESRALELLWAFNQPGVKAILVARGGYGSQRALRYLNDYIRPLRKLSPKIVVGYSDATYLLQWLQNQLGWSCFHGPLVGFLDHSRMKSFAKDLLELPTQQTSEVWTEVRVQKGRRAYAKGKLVGGNLSLLTVMGPAALPREPIILAIEDVNENYYRIDRMLRALIDAGYRSHVRGVICGSFLKCGEQDKKTFRFERILQTLRELTDGPIWLGGRFGHGVHHQRILPMGCFVEQRGRSLRILEAVVGSLE